LGREGSWHLINDRTALTHIASRFLFIAGANHFPKMIPALAIIHLKFGI
jgi:hypothetical protein